MLDVCLWRPQQGDFWLDPLNLHPSLAMQIGLSLIWGGGKQQVACTNEGLLQELDTGSNNDRMTGAHYVTQQIGFS